VWSPPHFTENQALPDAVDRALLPMTISSNAFRHPLPPHTRKVLPLPFRKQNNRSNIGRAITVLAVNSAPIALSLPPPSRPYTHTAPLKRKAITPRKFVYQHALPHASITFAGRTPKSPRPLPRMQVSTYTAANTDLPPFTAQCAAYHLLPIPHRPL